jgi:hypothetical protein
MVLSDANTTSEITKVYARTYYCSQFSIVAYGDRRSKGESMNLKIPFHLYEERPYLLNITYYCMLGG